MTSIEWTRGDDGSPGRTWNPVRGCTRVSEGCRNCYAETMAARNLPEMRSPTTGKSFAVRTPGGPRWTGTVELIPSKLDEPLRWRKPQRVFVNSMSDLFHESLPVEAQARVFAVMADASRHTFQVLTKRPEAMRAFMANSGVPTEMACWMKGNHRLPVAGAAWGGPWPLPNVWLGVSVEDQPTADERIPALLKAPAAIRFISLEPQLGPVDVAPFLHDSNCTPDLRRRALGCICAEPREVRLDWVIQGGESGHGARPFRLEWADAVREQCRAAGVAYFFKQAGSVPTYDLGVGTRNGWPDGAGYRKDIRPTNVLKLADRKGGDLDELHERYRVREFPKVGV